MSGSCPGNGIRPIRISSLWVLCLCIHTGELVAKRGRDREKVREEVKEVVDKMLELQQQIQVCTDSTYIDNISECEILC